MLSCIVLESSSLLGDLRSALAADTLATRLGFRLTTAAPGEISVAAQPGPDDVNAGGTVHGGFLSALADYATGVAVHTRLDHGYYAPHASLSLQYLHTARPDQELQCIARCVAAGRQSAGAEAEVRQGDRLIARAISSHTVIERRVT
jgi:acyl-CoA thioesterase